MSAAAPEHARLLRESDPDRYLSVLYAPPEKRDALVALYAFNVEIASIRDRVREPLPGEIRLQWWRDALAGGEGAVAGNPLAEALLAAVRQYDLPLVAIDNYLEARIADLYDDPLPDRIALEGYCGETSSALIQLASLVLAPREASRHASAAGHGGCALGITGLLRLMPVHRARGQCYVPGSILDAAGISRETFIEGTDAEGAARAVAAMVALAEEHLRMFGKHAGDVPAILRPAYLPLATIPIQLAPIAARRVDPTRQMMQFSSLRRNGAILRRALFGW